MALWLFLRKCYQDTNPFSSSSTGKLRPEEGKVIFKVTELVSDKNMIQLKSLIFQDYAYKPIPNSKVCNLAKGTTQNKQKSPQNTQPCISGEKISNWEAEAQDTSKVASQIHLDIRFFLCGQFFPHLEAKKSTADNTILSV